MEFTPLVIAILFSASILASFIQRVSGFGFGIFIMTILPYILPSYGESTTLSGLLALTQSFVVVCQMRRYLVWRRVAPMLCAFLITSYVAVGYVARFDTQIFMRVLGGMLIALSIYFYFFSGRVKISQSLPMQCSMGGLSGLMGGFFGMQGPPAVLYFIQSEPDKDHYAAQTQLYFVTGNLFMTYARAQNGFLTPAVGWSYCYAILGVAIGTYTGTKVFKRIPGTKLRKIVYAYMAVSGVVALLK